MRSFYQSLVQHSSNHVANFSLNSSQCEFMGILPVRARVRQGDGNRLRSFFHTHPYVSLMPLPAHTTPRRRLHTRRIEIEGYLREDGLFELDASLCDVKDVDYPIASGMRPAGQPVHLMRVRITIDAEFNILDAVACSDEVPYPGYCDTISPVYRKLVGLNLVRGFRRTISEMFADVNGCTHATEMLLSLPTAAIQTVATLSRDNEDTPEKPFQLDRCHALETSAAAVKQYYPRWYRARPGSSSNTQ
jgi:hypothetical protein